MPNVLKEKVEVKRSGRKPIHPYDEWFADAEKVTKKGQSFELVKGEDYRTCSTRTLRHSLYREGKKRGITPKTVTVVGDNGVESLVINSISPIKKKGNK
jgi:hypothetical protein